jgi:hypothetical protein
VQKFHVVCPLARFDNVPKLYNALKGHNVFWHIVTDDDNPKSHEFVPPQEDWIKHHICHNDRELFWDRSNTSLNWFLDNYPLEPEDMYCFLNDDDAYEPDFFDKLRNVIYNFPYEINVIITSMKRGDEIPESVKGTNRHHHTNTLIAHPIFMQPMKVGLEQILVKGKVLDLGFRFPRYDCGDGMLITAITQQVHTMYLPEVYVWFNYFEPGRWRNIDVFEK